LKPGSIGPPKIYLGGKVSQVDLPNGSKAWAFSASQYVQEAVKTLEQSLAEKGMKLSVSAPTPLTSGYRPELDVSPELDVGDSAQYQSLIGILRWIVELGRTDICCEVSMLSSHLALPREGHLQQVYHVFAYLKAKHNARLVFDATYPNIDIDEFPKQDWSSFYGDVKEEMGIPVGDPTFIYGDNKSGLYNTSLPESTLKKKMMSTAYHFVREGVAKDEWRTTYVKSAQNPSDVLTKTQSGPERIG